MKCFSQSKRCLNAQRNGWSSLKARNKICDLGKWLRSSTSEVHLSHGAALQRQSQETNLAFFSRGARRQASVCGRAFSQFPSFSVENQAGSHECPPDRPANEPITAAMAPVDREGAVLEVGDPVSFGSRVMMIDKTDRAHMIELRDSAEFQASTAQGSGRVGSGTWRRSWLVASVAMRAPNTGMRAFEPCAPAS